ncbi:hypothetical protein EJB05_20249, partial [Eragrostis curvula]
MAPKRSAPQPPVDSSEETASGSGSGSEESSSDESEEIAYSPPPSAGPKNTAPPPQKVQQPESSDEEEGDEEEEEEEEEEEDKVNQAIPPSTTKNPPPPPPNREESDSESEEEEETDDEAPESKHAPKQEVEGKGGKPPASSEDKKPASEDKKPAGRFIRVWSKDDDVRILEALAAHRREHGTLPQPDELDAALAGSLDHSDYGRKDLLGKLRSLKAAYTRQFNKGEQPSKDMDRRIYNLSKEVWGRGDMLENGTAPRDFGEMCELYPYFAEEIKGIEKTRPGLFKREFGMISDEKASALDAKIKKQRLMESKVELHRYENFKEVIKTLMDLVE